jgi:hypothetical protein
MAAAPIVRSRPEELRQITAVARHVTQRLSEAAVVARPAVPTLQFEVRLFALQLGQARACSRFCAQVLLCTQKSGSTHG